ncbi:MAG TPA: transcription termination/antitermination protein NusG [Planctomycetota bacterium]|nr:transcription termination/antitermination protein NusG [Planctomycetota bacterium]
MTLDWYFLRVQVGREDRIRESMIKRLKQEGIEAQVPQILVPTETIADHRQGKKTIKKRKLYPGYLMVQMELNEPVWFVLRETPGFGDFVGAHSTPSPASPDEVEKVLNRMDASKDQPKVAVNFKKGDRVKIKTGAFENMDATVEEVHSEKGTMEVSVNIFGRATPMSLGYWEVELI